MNDTFSVYLRNGTEVWANCETLDCAHGTALDLRALIDNPKVGDITLHDLKALNILKCDRCGQKNVHLNIHPTHRRY
jgi:hypothetical protein